MFQKRNGVCDGFTTSLWFNNNIRLWNNMYRAVFNPI